MKRAFLVTSSLLLAACAHQRPPVRFLDTPEDFARAGLGAEVAVKEDGRRSRPHTDDYEWWYLDGVAADGTVVVIVFSDNWLPGSRKRAVSLEVTRPGQATQHKAFFSDEPGRFSTEQADVHIGRSHFSGDLARYTVHVDPQDTGGFGCTLELTRRTASYRPGAGMVASGDDFFGWVVAVPEGRLQGTLTLGGETLAFDGSGYHDHNWGNVPPWALLRNWWWGRGVVDGRTVVMSEMRPAPGLGAHTLPLLFVGGPDGVVADVHGAEAKFTEGAGAPNYDASHEETRAGTVSLTAGGVTVTFSRKGAPVSSADLLAGQAGPVRAFARLAGRTPWYTRWKSRVSVEPTSPGKAGEGTIEFMDFE